MPMILEHILSEGISHLSYFIGDGEEAAVIDPRRDSGIYNEMSDMYGMCIKYIFETHRHEDFVCGSLELSNDTGAKIFHGSAIPFQYGKTVKHGETFTIGSLSLKILETPGHSLESLSIAVFHKDIPDTAFAVFTGDTLLPGSTGRIDLIPGKKREMAGKLYESLHRKIFPLGDQTVIYAAHTNGALSASHIDQKDMSTIGYEKRRNKSLRKKRKDFIDYKLKEENHFCFHFRYIEEINQKGVRLLAKLPAPEPVGAHAFKNKIDRENLFLLDVRSAEAFAGGHIRGSLNIPLALLPKYAGWFIPHDGKIAIVAENKNDVGIARLFLNRVGIEMPITYLSRGMRTWTAAGMDVHNLGVTNTSRLFKRAAAEKEPILILDVRSPSEFSKSPASYSRNIWLGDIPDKRKALPANRKIITLCNDGQESSIAAAYLMRTAGGFDDVEVCMGSADRFYELLSEKQKKKTTGGMRESH